MANNKYHGFFDGIKRDELAGGTLEPLELRNYEVAPDAKIERGMLMAAATPTGVYHLATAADTANTTTFYLIARDDFEADAEHVITTGYTSGVFNRERIKTASSDTAKIELFEGELRKQNIRLTSIKDMFGNEKY